MRTPIAFFALMVAAACTRPAASGAPAPVPAPSSGARVAAADSSPIHVPDTVSTWRLIATEPIRGTDEGGMLYRFSDGSPTRMTVFVYPIPADDATEPTDSAKADREGGKFAAVMKLAAERGMYEVTRVVFARPDSVVVDGATIPGYAAGAAARRNGQVSVELQYLYLIHARFVKVRMSLPSEGWESSEAPDFAPTIARILAAR